jgi:hypothetical protein
MNIDFRVTVKNRFNLPNNLQYELLATNTKFNLHLWAVLDVNFWMDGHDLSNMHIYVLFEKSAQKLNLSFT